MKVLDGYDINITWAKLFYFSTIKLKRKNIVGLYVPAPSQIIVWHC